jgi:serine O-acetyltransferase
MIDLLKAYHKYDPATESYLEILLLYPGLKAIGLHRLASGLYRAKIPFLPRMLGELCRWLTGIEIHPGARIGKRVIFDHGMGIVIGQTAIVGDDVIIYQGVTLGGMNLELVKRYLIIENYVVIGAGAKVLGNITIGEGSRIGANSVVVESVPPHSTVVGIPGKVKSGGVEPGEELCHDKIK